jgi:hypothetical protein
MYFLMSMATKLASARVFKKLRERRLIKCLLAPTASSWDAMVDGPVASRFSIEKL